MASKRSDPPPDGSAEVVSLSHKRVEKLTGEIQTLAKAMTAQTDEQVATIVGQYRQWELEHPETALHPKHKLAMVRYGFVGPGGYVRCHEPHRLPQTAFFLDDGGVDEQIRRDQDAAEVVMCPAMEAGLCKGVWSAVRMPPCYLLLLEVYDGLGGGAIDDSVQEVVDDVGLWDGPEQCEESFARGERAVKKYWDRL